MLRREFIIGPTALVACDSDEPARRVQTTDPAPPTVPTAVQPPAPPAPKPVAPPKTQHAGTGPDEPAMRAAGACIAVGQVCLQHCLGLLGVGDVALAERARSVADMIAISEATQALAAAGAPELKALARVAEAVLVRCEACCRKHFAKHEACRDCAERCAAARKEYRRLAA